MARVAWRGGRGRKRWRAAVARYVHTVTAVIAKLAAAAVGDLADFMTIDRVTCVSER